MNLHPEEISGIIKSQIKHYKDKIDQAEVGTVVMVGDGIAKAYGLENCMSNELLEFEDLELHRTLRKIQFLLHFFLIPQRLKREILSDEHARL